MAAPTRAQIEADVARPFVQVTLDGVDVTQYVRRDVAVDLAQTTGQDGIGFGAAVSPAADIPIVADAFSLAWEERPITIAYGFEGSDAVMYFRGVVTEQERGRTVGSWRVRGFDAVIESTDIRSLAFRDRAVATRTASGSIEDPDEPGYRAGLVNFIFWQSGGRPWEQALSYPGALFYYQCEDALLTPPYTWANGENGWALLNTLCRAAGGVVYQDSRGVMRYVSPLGLASGTPTFHWTDAALTGAQRVSLNQGNYGDIQRSASTRLAVGTVRCPFVWRAPDLPQEIYANQQPFPLAPGASRTIELDLQVPCLRLDGIAIVAGLAARARRATASEVTITGTLTAAQRVTAVVTNTTSERVTVYEVSATGVPLVAGEEDEARYSAIVGRPRGRDLELEDSPFIQSRLFAERRARMFWDYYADPRPIVTLSRCGFDPDRQLGEIASLTCSRWGMSAVAHRIVALRPARAGRLMDVDLIPIAGLPTRTDYLMIDQTYENPATLLRLAY